MKFRYYWLGFFLIILLRGNAQECFEYYKDHCIPPESRFDYTQNVASASYLFNSGELRRIPFTLMAKKDYRITICGADVFEGIIKFDIRTQLGDILYDNSTHDFSLYTEFSNKKEQEVFFELIAPEPSAGISDTIYMEGCIGILIEEMNSINLGF